MKNIPFLLLSLFIIASCTPNKEDIIKDFISAVDCKNFIRYSTTFTLYDESKGATEIPGICNFKIVPKDTIIGAYYHFKGKDYLTVYSGDEMLEYRPGTYGDNIVDILTKKNYPKEFTEQEFVMNGQKFYAPSRVKSSFLYGCSIIELKKDIQKYTKDSTPCRILPDTSINGYHCRRLIFTLMDSVIHNERILITQTYAFDKKTDMLVYFEQYHPAQQQETYFKDFKFKDESKKDLFSRKFFPKNYKFIEKAEGIKENKDLPLNAAVPNWELPSISDKNVKLEDLKGFPVFLIFSEIGCVPCMLALPELNELANEYKNIKVIGIYPLDSKEALKKLAKKKEIVYDILYNSKEVAKKYFVSGYPTFFLIDKHGILRYSSAGYGEGMKKYWLKEIEKVIGKKGRK